MLALSSLQPVGASKSNLAHTCAMCPLPHYGPADHFQLQGLGFTSSCIGTTSHHHTPPPPSRIATPHLSYRPSCHDTCSSGTPYHCALHNPWPGTHLAPPLIPSGPPFRRPGHHLPGRGPPRVPRQQEQPVRAHHGRQDGAPIAGHGLPAGLSFPAGLGSSAWLGCGRALLGRHQFYQLPVRSGARTGSSTACQRRG